MADAGDFLIVAGIIVNDAQEFLNNDFLAEFFEGNPLNSGSGGFAEEDGAAGKVPEVFGRDTPEGE